MTVVGEPSPTAGEVEELASCAADGFARRYERSPTGVVVAPGRVNLLGEHTDYNQGYVLPCAIDRFLAVAIAPRDDDLACCSSTSAGDATVRLSSVNTASPLQGWACYPAGVAWALGDAGISVPGFDLFVESDLPPGAGLASSAALECATGIGLLAMVGHPLEQGALAKICQQAENEIVGAPTGIMDQMACLLGVSSRALFIDCRTLDVEPVPFDPTAGSLELLVIDTRVRHDLTAGGYATRRRGCEEAAARLGIASLRDLELDALDLGRGKLSETQYRLARHVVTENQRVLRGCEHLRSGDLASIGKLFSESHRSLRDDFAVSCLELDTAVFAANEAGALGARLTGAGFGGCAIALVPADRCAEVTLAVQEAAERISAPPVAIHRVEAVEGARQVR
ncbi:MAG: galactokinase [Acidimicrobiales bacterium]